MSVNSLSIGGGDYQPTGFQFANAGDTVKGKITEIEPNIQQTAYGTGEPLYWDAEKTRPKTMHRVQLQTDLRGGAGIVPRKWQEWVDEHGDEDSGERTIYLKGSVKSETKSIMAAVGDAVRAAGADSIAVGGTLQVQYIGDGSDYSRGNAPKLYTASYAAPSVDFAAAAQQEAPADPVAAPAPAPAAPAAAPAPAGDPAALQAALANLSPEQRKALGL